MKKLLLLSLLPFFIFCNTNKKNVEKNDQTSSTINNATTAMNDKISLCPSDGTCTFELLKNKSLDIKKDDLGGIYFNVVDNDQTSVIKYKYNKTVDPKYQDGFYNEEIIFEIKNGNNKISNKDASLQDTKMLFGRHCYCKGEAGYFNVEKGNLEVNKNNNGEVQFSLDFEITQVPQIIKSIQGNLK
jgi:hypothetical protein